MLGRVEDLATEDDVLDEHRQHLHLVLQSLDFAVKSSVFFDKINLMGRHLVTKTININA